MEARELRYGNLFEYNGNIYTHQKFDGDLLIIDTGTDVLCVEVEDVNPVPLTEEWLIRFGVAKQNGYPYKYLNGYLKIRNGVFFFKYYALEVELPFVHNFQNLNFDLTGKELTTKPTT